MKIFLVKQHFFSFHEQESYDLDLLGRSVLTLMQEHFGVQACGQSELPQGDKIVLYPVYPFLTESEVLSLLSKREGSFSFRGGYVDRGGEMKETDFAFPDGLFTLADYPAVLSRAEREVCALHLGRGAVIEEGARVDFLSRLEEGAYIGAGANIVNSVIRKNAFVRGDSLIVNSVIGENCRVESSRILDSKVDKYCSVGPFSLLRQNCEIGQNCRIGDFVEMKNSTLGAGCKAAHLAYIGDATLGEKVNVGCGVVFANYNGKIKQRSYVGNGCFLGSNCNLIAPVRLGDGVFLAAGTTLTRDLDSDDFCIGRCRETVKEGRGKEYLS